MSETDLFDVLKIRVLEDYMGDVAAAMDDAGYETSMRGNRLSHFTQDKDEPAYQIFELIVIRDDQKLKDVLDGYGGIFDVTIKPYEELVPSPEREAATLEWLQDITLTPA